MTMFWLLAAVVALTGASTPVGCFTDLAPSGTTNAADLFSLLASWGPLSAPAAADLTRDGAVNANDAFLLLAAVSACGARCLHP